MTTQPTLQDTWVDACGKSGVYGVMGPDMTLTEVFPPQKELLDDIFAACSQEASMEHDLEGDLDAPAL